MLAARVEPKNGPQENKKTGNFKPVALGQFQTGVDSYRHLGDLATIGRRAAGPALPSRDGGAASKGRLMRRVSRHD